MSITDAEKTAAAKKWAKASPTGRWLLAEIERLEALVIRTRTESTHLGTKP